jgi:hypothetical protein
MYEKGDVGFKKFDQDAEKDYPAIMPGRPRLDTPGVLDQVMGRGPKG